MNRKNICEICTLIMGQSPDSKSYNKDKNGIPFYQGNADFGEEHPTPTVWCTAPKKIARKGDILISVRAPIGDMNIANEDCCIGRGLAAIRLNKSDIVDINYLYHYLSATVEFLQEQGTGSTFKAINKTTLEGIEIPCPSIEKQKNIAKLIIEIKTSIQYKKAELFALNELVKSRFIEMFGDPVENPLGWKKVALSDVAEIKIGPFGSLLHKEDYIENGHPLVNPSHIIDGSISTDSKLSISDVKYAELNSYHLKVGDVVLGRRGEMGRCAVVKTDSLLCGTGSLIIRANEDVTSEFIQNIISFPSYKEYIEGMAIGQTMRNLNVPIVSNLQIIKPPLDVQKQYYDFVKLIDKSKFVG